MRKLLSLLIASIILSSSYAANKPAVNPNSFILSSPVFANTGMLPVRYTCDGKNIPPELNWKGVPDKTAALALILSDPDAPGGTFYHWALYNIPNTINSLSLDINTLPAGFVVVKNSWNKN